MSRADLSRELGLTTKGYLVVQLSDEERWAWREWCVYHRTTSAKAMREAMAKLMAASPVPPRVEPCKSSGEPKAAA